MSATETTMNAKKRVRDGEEKKDTNEQDPSKRGKLEKQPPIASAHSLSSPHSPGLDRKPAASTLKPAPFKLRKITAFQSDNRRTNDEIHSSIRLGPVFTAILDTAPMQRLKKLNQLGTADNVYCNANHTRFQHSLGVAYLAEKLCLMIQLKQPGLGCTAKDVLLVKLAGLLHDIGHGPFSHAYETFLSTVLPRHLREHPEHAHIYQQWPERPATWQHESASLMMIDYSLAHLGLAIDLEHLDEPLKQIGDGVDAQSMRVFGQQTTQTGMGGGEEDGDQILTSRDFVFVKECIWGKPIPEIEAALGERGFHGRRGEHQEWLYDIVANRHSGLDVDKVDYYARDARRALNESGEIDKKMIEEAVVAWAPCTKPAGCRTCHRPGKKHDGMHLMICYPEKLIGPVMQFFKTRFSLHSKIYKHKTNEAVALMMSDILCYADPFFRLPVAPLQGTIPGQAPVPFDSLPLSRAMLHPAAYMRLKDSVIDQIAGDSRPELKEAHKLIFRLENRMLYKCVASKRLRRSECDADRTIWKKKENEILQEILRIGGKHDTKQGKSVFLSEKDIIVHKCNMHHGSKDEDPLANIRFLEKAQLDQIDVTDYQALPEAKIVDEREYYALLPRTLMECSLRIYCRDSSEEKCGLLSHVFSLWWSEIHDELNSTPSFAAVGVSQEYSSDDDDDNNNFHARSPLAGQITQTPMSITPCRRKLG